MNNNIPQSIKTRLAQLAVFPEQYTLAELAEELHKLSMVAGRLSGETGFCPGMILKATRRILE